jgi:hypothetical protein
MLSLQTKNPVLEGGSNQLIIKVSTGVLVTSTSECSEMQFWSLWCEINEFTVTCNFMKI